MNSQNKALFDPIAQFCKDVGDHQMTILKDEGLYRHIRFAVPNYFENAFEIVTVPGSLMIRGDMGCYVFERIKDMFAFFRTAGSPKNIAQGVSFQVKPHYWAEKLVSCARPEGVKEFCREKFEAAVRAEFNLWKSQNAPSAEKAGEVWEAIDNEILGDEINSVESAQRAVFEFHFDGAAPDFSDFFEIEIERYTYHFLWCCAAVAWAVAFYDAHRPDVSSAAVSDLSDADLAAYCGA